MSSQEFSAQIVNAHEQTVEACMQQLISKDESSPAYASLDEMPDGIDIGLIIEEGVTTLQVEFGSSVEFEFFEHVYQTLESAGAEFNSVSLFDSSCGGSHVFESNFDLDINLDGKCIVFLGAMEEELEDMIELLNDPIVQTEVGADTKVVVIGSDVDSEQLAQAKSLNTLMITEAHFWAIHEVF